MMLSSHVPGFCMEQQEKANSKNGANGYRQPNGPSEQSPLLEVLSKCLTTVRMSDTGLFPSSTFLQAFYIQMQNTCKPPPPGWESTAQKGYTGISKPVGRNEVRLEVTYESDGLLHCLRSCGRVVRGLDRNRQKPDVSKRLGRFLL